MSAVYWEFFVNQSHQPLRIHHFLVPGGQIGEKAENILYVVCYSIGLISAWRMRYWVSSLMMIYHVCDSAIFTSCWFHFRGFSPSALSFLYETHCYSADWLVQSKTFVFWPRKKKTLATLAVFLSCARWLLGIFQGIWFEVTGTMHLCGPEFIILSCAGMPSIKEVLHRSEVFWSSYLE